MIDNKHFLRFMNQIGITTNQIASVLNMQYQQARQRVETLKFTAEEICLLSEYTTIPIIDLINIIMGRGSLKDITITYAITKQMAIEKLRQDDDFIRLILQCDFLGIGQRKRVVTETEMTIMKKHLKC